MKIKKHIPNILTLLNLLLGCIAIVFAFDNILISSYLIGIAAIFDFLDGMAARLLDVKSELGKQLDSLADLVSFGVVPGFIIYSMINTSSDCPALDVNGINLVPMVGFLIPLMSAYRLAKFNIDERQSDSFLGLPTPAVALLTASLPLILIQQTTIFDWSLVFFADLLNSSAFLIAFSVTLSVLLVVELPLFSLKFKSFSWNENKIRYIFILSSLILLLLLYFAAVPIIIILYICFSIYQIIQK